MQDLLFLSHRLPYPPDKGEKIRAWHVLRRLARSYRIHLGCFLDDSADRAHVPILRDLCADLACVDIADRSRALRLALNARPEQPLSLGYFRDRRLKAWAQAKLAGGIMRTLVYCSAMAPYALGAVRPGSRRVMDMVDVDSAKWAEYAAAARWPTRTLWTREARTLLAFERRAAAAMDRVTFVSEAEAALFRRLAPESAARIGHFDNGVDVDFFAPASFAPPLPAGGRTIVFTGTMDYRPNIDAVTWFSEAVWPGLLALDPTLRFVIVGANPAAGVKSLAARPGVIVTGRVPDVRPYLAHAAAVVAPLRIARGVQNKVLEAMAMARPVVASPAAFAGLRAMPGRDLLVAQDAPATVRAVSDILSGQSPALGAAARSHVVSCYRWDATLAELDSLFEERTPEFACDRA